MNFINDRELAIRFKEGAVPAKERLYYFIIFIMATTLPMSSFLYIYFYHSINKWDIYIDVFILIVTFFTTIFLYRTNAKGDNKEFIERFVCIGFPVTIRMLSFLVIFSIVFYFVIEIMTRNGIPEETSVYEFILVVVCAVYFYFRLTQSIKIASH